MTVDVQQAEAAVNGGIFATFGRRHTSGSAERPSQVPPAALFVQECVAAIEAYVGARVLRTTHILEELVEHVDELFDDPDYRRLRENLRASVSADMLRDAATNLSAPQQILAAAGQRNTSKVNRIARLIQCEMSASIQIMAQAAAHAVDTTGPIQRVTFARETILTDPRLPVVLKRGILAAHRAEVSMLTLGSSSTIDVSGAVIDAIVDLWERSQFQHVRTLAGFPNIKLPEDVIPLAERVDIVDAFRKRRESERSYQCQLSAARASGLAMYPDEELNE